ncbi:MAG: LruC domain-containing protein [bacterium]
MFNSRGFQLFLLVIIILTSACRKLNSYPGIPGERKMEDLKVASGFSWETTRKIEFSITSDQSVVISITSEDGTACYHKGFYSILSGPYNTIISLPAYVQKVLVNGVEVMITGSTIEVNLAGQGSPLKNSFIAASDQVPPQGLIAAWHFDENSGTVAGDALGQHNGTVYSSTWTPGIRGSALKFDGITGHVQVPYNASINLTGDKISFSFWFRQNQTGSEGTFIFQNVKYIVKIDSQGKVSFQLYTPAWRSIVMNYADRILDADWHHVAATYDGTTMKLFIDGVLKVSGTNSGTLNTSNSDVYIGNQNTINPFKGTMDEVLLYDRALTDSEVSMIYASTPDPDNGSGYLISSWALDEGYGNVVNDATGGNNGTITGATWSAGIAGTCLQFNGATDNVKIPNAFNLNPVNAITMMVWAKSEENKSAKIFQKGDWDGHGIGQDKWNGWQGGVRLDNNTSQTLEWGGGVPILNEWYHIAVTYDGTTLNLYVNGQLKNSKAISGKLKVNARDVSIGSDNASQKFFKGSVDEVRIYGKALSQTEIQANYNQQGNAPDADGDGVPDQDDSFPHDPARAFVNYFPASGFSTLAFEDLWPGTGDYDLNDLVVDYQFRAVTSASNRVTEINAKFVIRAVGASQSNGFGFQLPGAGLQQSDIQVEGYQKMENFIVLNPNGTEAGQEKITIIAFDNVNKIMHPVSGSFVNTEPGSPYIDPDTITISMIFSPNKYTISDIGLADFNPFLIVNMDRGKEVHLPDFPPTSLANTAYFRTAQDDSDPATGKYYKTANNLPWAIRISSSFSYTFENKEITSAYLMFAPWAESSGTLYPDWYLDVPGYRNAANIYLRP